MKKCILLIMLLFIPTSIKAMEGTLNDSCKIMLGETVQNRINDSDYYTYNDYEQDHELVITCDKEISYIYIYYNIDPVKGKINNTQELKGRYLHELTKLDTKTNAVTLSFEQAYSIADIYILDDNIPSWVENWDTLAKADMLLFSTHADDEQLFFAGLMPTYVNAGKNIQVVYFTNHYNATNRYHEMLEGLWAVGITHYPSVSIFPDATYLPKTLEEAIKILNDDGFTEDDALKFMTKMIRRYKPDVVVGHDENGEYSHGQHILNTHILKQAYQKAADNAYDEETINKYGTHQISKLYLHLYKENPIILNYDIPLDKFNGKTAYEVSKEGFAKHLSQQNTWFTDWLNGPNKEFTKATEIDSYIPGGVTGAEFSPCKYGLYFTNVGPDTGKNDMFENIETKPVSTTPIEEGESREEASNKTFIENTLKDKNFQIGTILIGVSVVGIIILLLTKRK